MRRGIRAHLLAAVMGVIAVHTPALAAPPAATQLPGQGTASGSGSVVPGSITNGIQTIAVSGTAIIQWGTVGGAINAAQPGGFNIGSAAGLTFDGTSGADAVLNIDISGNISQIMGQLDDGGSGTSIFVANKNGVIAGAHARVASTGALALMGSAIHTTGFDGTFSSLDYNGTGGGDVSVMPGASISGANIYVIGGNTVNVDLDDVAGTLVLSAGAPSAATGAFASANSEAQLDVSGALTGSSRMAGFISAGDAANSGSLDLSSAPATVAGTFMNPAGSTLTLAGADTLGDLVNQGAVTLKGLGVMGALDNSGSFDGGGKGIDVTKGGLLNTGEISNVYSLNVTGGVTNKSSIGDGTGPLGYLNVHGGQLTNSGAITMQDGQVQVFDGAFDNSGSIRGIYSLATYADDAFQSAADYSVTNTGELVFSGIAFIQAGVYGTNGAENTTGSFVNAGTMTLSGIDILAHDDVELGGDLLVGAQPVSVGNPLDSVTMSALTGKAELTTPIAFKSSASIRARQVDIMANLVSVVDANGQPPASTYLTIRAGAPSNGAYAVRVAKGVLARASEVDISGQQVDDLPDVILQGTLSGHSIYFGRPSGVADPYPVSDVFSGPSGGVVVTGSVSPTLAFYFTGAVKTASYLNDPQNFRYNGLPVSAPDGTLQLRLDPVAYTTHGTTNGKSAVNLLVDNAVVLDQDQTFSPSNLPSPGDSVARGAVSWPNTHLVLQSTGDITTPDPFYWPGLVYLGTIGTHADGSPAPGTLDAHDRIHISGDFSNVIPGNTDSGGGIHFMTAQPLDLHGTVMTNASSWINFATAALTHTYAASDGMFYAGASGTNGPVDYNALRADYYHTQAPDASR